MAKVKTSFVCQTCGNHSSKWIGKCNHCDEWNTYLEESNQSTGTSSISLKKRNQPTTLSQVKTLDIQRIILGDSELNRVLGGGVVPGSLILFGGEPGIGKSTLMLQLAVNNPSLKTLYVSGEESAEQIKIRAERISTILPDNTIILTETEVGYIIEHAKELQPDIIIIDSIQTIHNANLDSASGSISQIRECTNEVLKYAKPNGIPVFLIGHITKDGSLAGPKVLEHMVDTVLQFEGDRNHFYRIIRGTKNRFGSTNELGIYEMVESGLRGVSNPSKLLIGIRDKGFSGISIAANLEGVRPLFIETQALVSKSAYGTPQRSATGFDLRRLNMLLAVLEKKCGFRMGMEDVFLNITGGIKIEDPASDLSILTSIISSKEDIPIDPRYCFAGEVGLSGEIRPVQKIDLRIKEAEKLGFTKIYISKHSDLSSIKNKTNISIEKVGKIQEVFEFLFS
jgi:DNA repair protein RadA/Sms